MNNKPKSSRLFFWSRIVSIGAIIVVMLFASYGLYLAQKVNSMQEQWIEYNQQFTKIASSLQELHDALGYGGLIHDFKNYVLRYNPKYDERTQVSFQNSRQALAYLEKNLSVPSTLDDTQEIKRTIDEYYQNYQHFRDQDNSKLSAEARDQLVKVDDAPAFAALARLRQFIVTQSELQQINTDAAVTEVLNLVYRGGWFAPMLLIVVLMMNLLMGRLRSAYLDVQNAHEFIDNLLSHSPDALLVLNSEGSIIRTNTKATQLFAYTAEELLQLDIESLMPEKYRSGHVSIRSDYMSGEFSQTVMSRPLPILTKDGRAPVCEIALSCSGEGNSRVVTASIRDVSEQEKTRTALKEAKYKAEINLKRLTETQESLIRSEKLASLGGLVAGIAHEINTPVGVTVSAASHLEDETRRILKLYQGEDLGADDLERYFDVCSEATRLICLNSQRAAELIQSFKQVAVDQTSEEKRNFELKNYIHEIILSLKPKLKKHPHEILLDCPTEISLDSYPGVFSQCLSNLILNSFSHAWDEGEQGTIQIGVENLANDWIKIVYQDNGKGIPQAHRGKIFDPFFTTKRGSGGSGLGLHILHNLIYQRLGGEVELIHKEGSGVTFIIKLPKNCSDLKTINKEESR